MKTSSVLVILILSLNWQLDCISLSITIYDYHSSNNANPVTTDIEAEEGESFESLQKKIAQKLSHNHSQNTFFATSTKELIVETAYQQQIHANNLVFVVAPSIPTQPEFSVDRKVDDVKVEMELASHSDIRPLMLPQIEDERAIEFTESVISRMLTSRCCQLSCTFICVLAILFLSTSAQ